MSLRTFILGLSASFGVAWLAIVVIPFFKMRNLEPVRLDEATDGATGIFYPKRTGRIADGSRVYAQNGCYLCHSQLVRPTYAGNDLFRPDWGGLKSDGDRGDTRQLGFNTKKNSAGQQALRTTEFFELQRFVLHGQFVATLALAVEPLEDFRSQPKCTAQKASEKGLDHWAPPINLSLMAAPTSNMAKMAVVTTLIVVRQAVRRASRHAVMAGCGLRTSMTPNRWSRSIRLALA